MILRAYRKAIRFAASALPRASAPPPAAVLAFVLAAALIGVGWAPAPARAEGWALGGMDAVAYRERSVAVPGQSGIATRWAGQEWHFSTEANRSVFEANPRAFAPGMRGLCPFALSQGREVPGNPRFFAVIGKRLYLFETDHARREFLRDPRGLLMNAKASFVRRRP